MKYYLLSVVQPGEGVPPGPEGVARINRDLEIFHRELREAGSWVLVGGTVRRRPPGCAPPTAPP
ncbi:hypothetical protein ACFOZ0_02570 [Streptomyces yaanensis]|uniref:YCII-related domain-containing protein n=1 Tax=Streptomyces yaanensis TaxID=1142239 RepID=A0ABV7S7H9_9ACTN|nr:hypothetical protein [Streptomyces sp. CGMCC 4.7035]WNB99765.1 hypothetical protein Q2K21_17785 [Streptomyces sp. CGMCC 4.7035]